MSGGIRKSQRLQKLAFLLTAVLLFGSWADSDAGAASINLGAAGPHKWALLALGGGDVRFNNYAYVSGQVDEVGVASPRNPTIYFKLNTGASCPGDRYLGTNVKEQLNYPVTVGNKITGPTANNLLNAARNDALYWSGQYGGLLPTPGFPTNINLGLNKKLTLTGGHGLNVVNLTNFIQNSGSTVRFEGFADTLFILNITGTFRTNSGSKMEFSGLSPSQVLFNYRGTKDVSIGASTQGILLAPYANVTLTQNVLWTGEIIAGKAFSLNAGAGIINLTMTPIPLPTSWLLLGTGLLGLGLLGWRRQRHPNRK